MSSDFLNPAAKKPDVPLSFALFVAGCFTAQSLNVLIHIMNQILRTNAAMLKLQSENLATGIHRNKLKSEHFNMQYEGLARAFGDLKPDYSLPSLSGGPQ